MGIKSIVTRFVRNKLFVYKHRDCDIDRPLIITNSKYITLGNNVRIKKGARIECYDVFAKKKLVPSVNIANDVIIQYNFTCLSSDIVDIGENTIIASNVSIMTHNHGINPEAAIPYHAQPLSTRPVLIGQNCWIGENVVLLPGAKIGDYSIVAAGAIVNKEFPSYTILAGVPAKIIKKWDFDLHKWVKVKNNNSLINEYAKESKNE